MVVIYNYGTERNFKDSNQIRSSICVNDQVLELVALLVAPLAKYDEILDI